MKLIKTFLIIGLLAGAPLLTISCSKQAADSNVVKRPGEPDYIRVENDKEMDAAIEQAKKSVQEFIVALGFPKPTQTSFSVKKPFKQGEKVEHIWLTEVTYDGKDFHGEVGNDPVDVVGVKQGGKVAVGKEEISDWMYIGGRKRVGGYTVKVLYSQMKPEDQKDFLEHVDSTLEWEL